MANLLFYLKLYGRFQGMNLRASVEYEKDFWIAIVGTLLSRGAISSAP